MICNAAARKAGRRLLLLICALLLLCQTAFAAGATLRLEYGQNGTAFAIYRVADFVGNGYVLAGDFAAYPVSIPENGGSSEAWRSAAFTLASYATADDLAPLARGAVADGQLSFDNLERGLYLVVGEAGVIGGVRYTPLPFLVRVDGSGVATATVKSDSGTEPEESYTVRKLWVGDAEDTRPSGVEVQLLKDGVLYDTVTLSEANGWEYTWSELDGRAQWLLVERSVPEGYSVSICREGTVFTITNSFRDGTQAGEEPAPPEPQEPSEPLLPQTGQLWWPVLPLLLCGGLLVLSGRLRRHKQQDEET